MKINKVSETLFRLSTGQAAFAVLLLVAGMVLTMPDARGADNSFIKTPSGIYLRGTMNDWGYDEASEFFYLGDDRSVIYLTNVSISTNDSFKIADSSWNEINFGAYDENGLSLNRPYVLEYNGSNLYLSEDAVNVDMKFDLSTYEFLVGYNLVSVDSSAPVFTPGSCGFYDPIEVLISADGSAAIYYTLDGSAPTETTGIRYVSPIRVESTTTIKAVAVNTEGGLSSVSTATYRSRKHGIGEGYNPSSPPDPDSSDLAELCKVMVVVNPFGAGETNYVSTSKLRPGETINLWAYAYSDFVFANWTVDGEVVSESPSFNYTVPDTDVAIVANFTYSPSGPGNPDTPKPAHPVSVTGSPASGGYFNFASASVKEGESVDIYAYSNTDFLFKGWEVDGRQIAQTTLPLVVTMGDKAVTVKGLFEYHPTNPSNPGANYYNPTTGQVIVDEFTPGNLYSTIRNLVGSNNYSNVSSLIVKGVLTTNDFGVLGNFPNAETIDISRTGGVNALPSYAFSDVQASNIMLPSDISSLGNRVFQGCGNLGSLTIYAYEPPVCNAYTFAGFDNKANCIVYVPVSAVELYVNADYWKDFMILPIMSDAYVLQVNLPESASDGRYKNNSLEIVNVNTGVRQKYVISDRLLYTFNGLQKDEVYNVYMFSKSGLEIGKIENVIIPDRDSEVTFDNLKSLYTVSAQVSTPEGENVTPDVTVEWLKPLADGTVTYLRKGVSLGEIPEGQKLICRATLNNRLGVKYAAPEDAEFVVSGELNICEITLVPFRNIELNGTVVDGDNAALSGASVSVNQTLNGKYPKSYTAKTDRQGKWSLSVYDAPETRLVYAADECINISDTIGAFPSDVTTLDLGTKTLKSIVGARVTYGFSYHAAGAEEVQDYYSDYQNVLVSVFNVTQNRAHNDISLQYPVLAVLDENINAGDELRLTATSKKGDFNPIEKTVTIGENQRAEVKFDIIGKGGISASYEMTDNKGVTAMLYNAKGELVKKMDYTEAKATFTGLEDGDYTIVSMGQSNLMNSILRLSTFAEIGLTEGVHYVKNAVRVETGELTEVRNSEIPPFDESVFYYTTTTTTFSSNKSSITTGNYLTLRAAIDFKGVYKKEISNVALVVDLPEACDFVEESVIQGPNLLPYTLDNNRLTVQLGNAYTAQTRFCVIPTNGGSFNATASIVFDYNGQTVTQPIGAAVSEIKDIEISVPSVVQVPTFKVSGTASGNSNVKIFEDGTILGSGKANASGSWNLECSLINPYNLSSHKIYAEITTPAGTTMTTESKTLTYDINALQVSKVTMYHWNPWMCKTYVSEFDFLNPKTSATQWIVYYPKKQFTYTIEFTDNDPQRISNVILYVHTADRKFVPVHASFDEKKGMWYAEIDMGTSPDGYYPVNCSVDFDYDVEKLLDTAEFNNIRSEFNNISSNFNDVKILIDDVINTSDDSNIEDIERTDIIDWAAILDQAIGSSDSEDERNSLDYFLSLDDSDLDAYINTLDLVNEEDELAAMDSSLQELIDIMSNNISNDIVFENGVIMSVKTCEGLIEESLIERGFQFFATTGGRGVYVLRTDNSSEVVDFDNNNYVIVTYGEVAVASYLPIMRSASNLDKFNEIMENINGLYQPIAHAWEETNDKLLNFVDKFYQDYCKNASDYGRKKARYNSKFAKLTRLKEELKGLNSLNIEYHIKLGEIQSLQKEVKTAKKLMDNAARLKSLAKAAHNLIKPLPGIFAKRLPLVKYADAIYTFLSVAQKYQSLYLSIPNPCKDDQGASDNLRTSCIQEAVSTEGVATLKLGASAILDLATFGAVSTAVGTGGASLIVAAGTAITNILANILIDKAFDKQVQKSINDIKSKRDKLECVKKCGQPGYSPCPNDDDGGNGGNKPGGGVHQSGSPSDGVQIDPSGYVYEAVPENRVEGVQASIYYKETKEDMYGDPYEEIVLWNAEEYAQKNPLFTDENGMYRWDVPQGLWQVKFEKDGYVTAYSEWLPVPPPQLDVNIGIVQNKQPEVANARAYEEGVEVQFDKFMDESSLNSDNIYVTANGEKLNGELRMIDSSLADAYASEDDAKGIRYASCVRFVPEEPLSVNTGEIRLTVSRKVKSYAGIPMTETYSQTLDVEKEVQAIVADDVKVLYGGQKELTVYALPDDAAAGRTLRIANSSDLIISVDKTEAVFDAEGKATLVVRGELPGRAQLTFNIDNVTVSGDCVVDVVTEILDAEAPSASRASGTAVYRGTTVELSTESQNGVIWYTTDGSCPCDENGTRLKYTEPITINEDIRILAVTVVGEGNDNMSETVEFNYTLKRSDMDFAMDEGWTWISHNFESPVAVTTLATDENVLRIMSQTREVIRDPQLGMVGMLQELNASESYKVETNSKTSRQRLSEIAWNPATPIALNSGWNWLGYPVSQTMSVDEAFAPTSAENLDVIVGQNGFAQFDGESWVGTLETLSPGLGYMYQSQSPKEVVYNTSIVSTASARYASGISRNSPLVLDIHKYPSVMPVVATVNDVDGTDLDDEDYQVNAFCRSECRGIGRVVNGLVMMNVYGNANDNITFQVTDKDGGVEFANDESMTFGEKVVGSLDAPYAISINSRSGIRDVAYDGNIKVSVVGDMLVIKGIAAGDIDLVEVYDTEGRKLIRETKVSESGVRVSQLNTGVYVVIVNGNGEYTYHKIALR